MLFLKFLEEYDRLALPLYLRSKGVHIEGGSFFPTAHTDKDLAFVTSDQGNRGSDAVGSAKSAV